MTGRRILQSTNSSLPICSTIALRSVKPAVSLPYSPLDFRSFYTRARICATCPIVAPNYLSRRISRIHYSAVKTSNRAFTTMLLDSDGKENSSSSSPSPPSPNKSKKPVLPPDIEDIHRLACAQNLRHYKDPATGYTVFTDLFHLDRGSCCGNSCRHCPFDHVNVGQKGVKKARKKVVGVGDGTILEAE
jgi:hypothetical protein